MKKYTSVLVFSVMLMGCGAAQTVSVAPADEARIQALELQQKSSSERIANLEKELSETKAALERSQRQSKQLGESYDTLVNMMKDYKQLIGNIMENVGKMVKEKDTPKTN